MKSVRTFAAGIAGSAAIGAALLLGAAPASAAPVTSPSVNQQEDSSSGGISGWGSRPPEYQSPYQLAHAYHGDGRWHHRRWHGHR